MFKSNKIFPIKFINPETIIKSDSCSICLKKFNKNNITIACGHQFHSQCILKWMENKKNCPICRVNLKFSKVHQ